MQAGSHRELIAVCIHEVTTQTATERPPSVDAEFVILFQATKPIGKPSIRAEALIIALQALSCRWRFGGGFGYCGRQIKSELILTRSIADVSCQVRRCNFARLLCLKTEAERAIQPLPEFATCLDRCDSNDLFCRQGKLLASGLYAHSGFMLWRQQFPVILGSVCNFDFQKLLAGDTNDIFPVDANGTHRIGRVTQRAEIERFDFTRHRVTVQQDDNIRFRGISGYRKQYSNQEQYGAMILTIDEHVFSLWIAVVWLLSGCFSIFARTDAGPALECPRKIALVGKAYHEGDLRLGLVAVFEIMCRERSPSCLQNVSVTRTLSTKLPLQGTSAAM